MLTISGYDIIIDNQDLQLVAGRSWRVQDFNGKKYVVCGDGGNKRMLMHRLILGLTHGDGMTVDHINGNGLDNRRSNLRLCTKQQNQMNQLPQSGRSSSYKGVSFHKHTGKWRASIKHNRQTISLGYYRNENFAAYAYNYAAKSLFGDFANLNNIEGLLTS